MLRLLNSSPNSLAHGPNICSEGCIPESCDSGDGCRHFKKLLSARRKGGLWCASPRFPPTQLQVGGTLLQEHHAERPGVSDTARLCGYVSPLPLHSLHTTLTLSSHDTRNAPRGPIGGIVISAGLMGGNQHESDETEEEGYVSTKFNQTRFCLRSSLLRGSAKPPGARTDRVRPVRRRGGGRVDAMIRKYQSIYETFTWLIRVTFTVNN